MKILEAGDLKAGVMYRADLAALKKNPIINMFGEPFERAFGLSPLFMMDKDGWLRWVGGYSGMNRFSAAGSNYIVAEEAPDFQWLAFDAREGLTRRAINTAWDPEVFVVDSKGKMIPAFHILPDKKDLAPNLEHPTAKSYNDGFQAEFCTFQSHCHGYGFDRIRGGLQQILVAARLYDSGSKLTLQNFFELPSKTLQDATPEQVFLGCKPSLNAYDSNPFICDDPFTFPYRMAGGHVHFGLLSERIDSTQKRRMVMLMDFFAALPAVGMFAEIDDPRRRQYYGKAGEYRLPSHGLEYRTLSNAWLGHPSVGHLLMDMTRMGTMYPWYNEFDISSFGVSSEQIQDIINNCDVQTARKIVEKNKDLWDVLLTRAYRGNPLKKNQKAFMKMVQEGVESIVPKYLDIESNWKLNSYWDTHSDGSRATWASLVSKLDAQQLG